MYLVGYGTTYDCLLPLRIKVLRYFAEGSKYCGKILCFWKISMIVRKSVLVGKCWFVKYFLDQREIFSSGKSLACGKLP